ncbi:hypothetical protein CNR22_19215 [Sphingobacteriaceae bacterium]|nr:hypothetical protein CNR22_19215 [Sphingobacteriaceae bacterium]
MNWYLKVLKQYADFKGRARRKEYWMFFLFNFIIWMVMVAVSMILAITGGMAAAPVLSILLAIYYLGIIVPGLAVTVRRLHDQNKSGTWFFLAFFPLIGGIWLLVLMCTEGTSGPNQYGADPKNGESFNEDALDSHLST